MDSLYSTRPNKQRYHVGGKLLLERMNFAENEMADWNSDLTSRYCTANSLICRLLICVGKNFRWRAVHFVMAGQIRSLCRRWTESSACRRVLRPAAAYYATHARCCRGLPDRNLDHCLLFLSVYPNGRIESRSQFLCKANDAPHCLPLP